MRRIDKPGLRWLPHFAHAKKIEGVSQMCGTTNDPWWKELWWLVTGQHYEHKDHDGPP